MPAGCRLTADRVITGNSEKTDVKLTQPTHSPRGLFFLAISEPRWPPMAWPKVATQQDGVVVVYHLLADDCYAVVPQSPQQAPHSLAPCQRIDLSGADES